MTRVGLFFLCILLVACLAAFGTYQWTAIRQAPSEADAHAWLHRELKLTPEQEKALEPVEASFALKQEQLNAALREANRQLAVAIAEDKASTPRVMAAVEQVHHRMGDLQKASIDHLFAMREKLASAQGEKLLQLARQSLEDSR